MAVPYPAQNPPGAQQDPNLGNIAGPPGSERTSALTVNNPAGAIQAHPPQGFGAPERIDRGDEQGVIFLSNFGNYYRVPKYTTSIIRKYQDNVYAAGIYHKQRHMLFREKYEIIVHDPDGETDTDECTAIVNDMVKMLDAVMVQPHTYGLQAAIEMSWADCFWFGISLYNPVWAWIDQNGAEIRIRPITQKADGTGATSYWVWLDSTGKVTKAEKAGELSPVTNMWDNDVWDPTLREENIHWVDEDDPVAITNALSGAEYHLIKLRHLPAESFGTQPYGRPFLYSDIMQGIVISPYDGSVEYFQTLYMPQNNAPPGPVVSTQFLQTKLTNIVTIKDPAFPDLAGKPVMLPIFPLIAMLDFTWQAQVQRVNRIGAPILFLKIINPQGNDIEYGQLLLQNWGKNSGFQLRANFEIIEPGIQDSGSALETIDALNKLITQYFNPANQVQRSENAPLSGASGSEKEMVDDYTRNVHSWLETQWSHILQEYLDVNGYEGYTVEVDIPDPSIDRSTIELQQADKLFTTKTGLPNEIRKKLGVDELDEAGLAELKEYYASLPQPSPFGAFGGAEPAQPGAEPGKEPVPPGPEEGAEPAKGETPLMQKARLALEAVRADELNPDRYVEDDKVKKIVNAALDEGSAFPQDPTDTTENIGGSGITQAAFWPSAGEVPQDVIKILTESYQYASSASKFPPDSADRDREAREYAWQAVAKAGWKKTEAGWVQTAGINAAGGIESVKNAEENGDWITIRGTHVFVGEGESKSEAFKDTTGKSLKGGSSKPAPKKEAAPTKAKPAEKPSAKPAAPSGSLDTDKALVKSMAKSNNKTVGEKAAAETEKNLSDHQAYGKSDLVQNSDALADYTSSGYTKTNADLRSGKVGKGVTEIDKIIAGAPALPEGTTLYRGIGGNSVATMMNMQPGDTCNDKAFQSFSTSPFTASSFSAMGGSDGKDKVIFRAVTSGKEKGLVIGGGEHEVIMPRGQGWKVVSNNAVTTGVHAGRVTTHVITVVPA
jgi:hypothetical protein